MINELFKELNNRMIKAVSHYRNEVAHVRTGRASVNILDPIKIDGCLYLQKQH